MKAVSVSELKAKLAKHLRLVREGEEVHIQDRGVPIAVLSPIHGTRPLSFISPRKDPARLAQMKFSVTVSPQVDVVSILLEERKRR